MADLRRPEPEEYQPPLTWAGAATRVAVVIAVSSAVWITIGEPRSTVQTGVDLVLGAVALAFVWFRRRAPLTVALATAACSSLSAVASGPAVLATLSLATTQRRGPVLVAAVAQLFAGLAFGAIYPAEDAGPWWVTVTTAVISTSALLAWGMYVGARRELLWTLRARAERAEAEQELRAEQSRLAERTRIAREMHDVLAHQITRISMLAGALSYRDGSTADELRDGVGVIRDTANEALTDLRGVLGVLRDRSGATQHAPQPTYADLSELVEDARRTGLRVVYADTVANEPVPEATGRTLYRIVQEGLTNARKHAPGAELTIDVKGSPGDGLEVVLRNPVGFGPSATPGSGLGLIGLAERAALRGGRIEREESAGTFVLRGWVPWST